MSRICRKFCWLLACSATLACLNFASLVQAQETTESLFPTSPDAWLNSPPLTSEMLQNKAAILYFFEEG